ncbi:holo-ACP synthase [Selenomonas sp. oral taxon 136]|uniref:holo-ACP synthase n=1 Tax=Selenomonas sp. oral taxon 136 TaxID=713030 RepID=UPI0007682601|nr:holo-ACP synthase [Selenomonas sp. oral taxon 136]AME04052.1 4-phosphopantetheinyl transferase [Selenomonas sp. oral taxon 136]
MILGVGCDIIRVARVARAAEKEHFLARVYTPAERAYAMQRGAGSAASLAARFAGKEAVLKAFGTGLRGGTLHDVEILPDALGAPKVHLHGFFAARAAEMGVTRVWVTLSHEKEYATAYCILEGQ